MSEISKKALSEAELLKEIYKKLAGESQNIDITKALSRASILRAICDAIPLKPKIYRALVSMGNGSVAKLFENSLGHEVTWVHTPGTNTASIPALAGQNNVFVSANPSISNDYAFCHISTEFIPTTWEVKVKMWDSEGDLYDNQWYFVEIILYP